MSINNLVRNILPAAPNCVSAVWAFSSTNPFQRKTEGGLEVGQIEVKVVGSRGNVFTGIDNLGWKRRFEAVQIKTIKSHRKHNSEGADTISILIETCEGKQIKFGSMLTNERRHFMLGALRKTLCPLDMQFNDAQRQKPGEDE